MIVPHCKPYFDRRLSPRTQDRLLRFSDGVHPVRYLDRPDRRISTTARTDAPYWTTRLRINLDDLLALPNHLVLTIHWQGRAYRVRVQTLWDKGKPVSGNGWTFSTKLLKPVAHETGERA